MPLQKRIAGVGLSKQTAKGSPVAAATFGLGVRGGSVFNVELAQENDAITFSSRISAYDNRTGVNPGASVATRAWPRSMGLLLYGALGAISTSGAGPYTHTITPGATLPYLTHFAQLDTEYFKLQDSKINTLTISWTERGPVEVEYELLGTIATLYTASYTVTNDESQQNRFIPPGGVFQVDGKDASPATASIVGGRISIQNNLVPIPLSASVVPDDIMEAEAMIEYELRLMPTDTVLWRELTTGASAGTAPTGFEVYGSASSKFTISASEDMTLAATKVAFLGDYPEADPSGGPAEVTVVGRVKKPAGAAFTATVINATASY